MNTEAKIETPLSHHHENEMNDSTYVWGEILTLISLLSIVVPILSKAAPMMHIHLSIPTIWQDVFFYLGGSISTISGLMSIVLKVKAWKEMKSRRKQDGHEPF